MILIYVALKMQVKGFLGFFDTFEDLKIRFSLCLIN